MVTREKMGDLKRLKIILKNLEVLEKENKKYRNIVKSQVVLELIESISEDLRTMLNKGGL